MKCVKYIFGVLVFILVSGCEKDPIESKVPKAPNNFSVSVSSMWATFTWQDNSDDETKFYIERKSGSGDWSLRYQTDANETTFKEHVSWAVSYPSYRVYAYNGYGKSDYSNVVSITTYNSAYLWIYLCPDAFTGCSSNYINLSGNCRAITGAATPGAWYDTGFEILANRSYAVAMCQSCPSDCGSPTAIETPEVFFKINYYPDIYFYCQTPCTPSDPPE